MHSSPANVSLARPKRQTQHKPPEWKLKDAKSISKKQQTNLIWKKTTNEDVLKLTTKRRFIRANSQPPTDSNTNIARIANAVQVII